ncbi:glycosyltransferase [Salinisphaera japonica]|uniref:Glycosyl transferase n=1 Tax=Salinisphaera japonica YTM-1 TaxID=1209778 RepID=A0A423PWR5_9GAMM|nr:glycosyltransferase [Salinisphaera japonica]ROO30046.1 glycosyl transferase [Salinisphaera japonica YTM-1]
MFDSILLWLAVASLVIWLGVVLQPWLPWLMRERFAAEPRDAEGADLSDTTVIVPARNEAESIHETLAALRAQGQGLSVILVDDNSTDGTADIARASGLERLHVLTGAPLADGWTGKLWALEQARQHVTTPRVVLLDADIKIAPGTIAGLKHKAIAEDRALVSLMAHLRMASLAEKLLIPAFIYFFKLLYPFALSNAGSRWIAASAGGCVLIERATLSRIGGFGALHDAIIDDCTLARCVRNAGGRTWVGVTRSAISLRGYDDISGIHGMVARSAYSQLRYSRWLLGICTVAMIVMFWVPPVALLVGGPVTDALGALAWILMAISYLPTLLFYRQAGAWALAMPIIGTVYLVMTWSSAARYWRGLRSAWRGRDYQRDP